MVNFLFSLFSKDYCPSFPVGDTKIRECIFPYENILYGISVKGNFYVRKTTYTYQYKNPLLGKITKTKYSGLLHAIVEESGGWKNEIQHILIPNFFESDEDFLKDAYSRYEI